MSGLWHEQSFITPISERGTSLMKQGDAKNAAQSSHTWPTYGSHDSVKTPPAPTATSLAYHYHITSLPSICAISGSSTVICVLLVMSKYCQKSAS